ncbi:putative Mnd1 family [Trypanosoma cruzi]|nr:putative Mnd1 family [Trypanosoma cruzi]
MNLSLPQMQKELNALREEEAEARRRIQEVRAGIGDDASVRHDTMKMRQLQEEVKALRVELEKAAVFDPVMVEKVKATTRVALESANRWTDNVYLLEHHISQRMGLTPRELRMRLQLPADVDYIEFDELVPDREASPKATAATLERMSSSPQRAAENAAGGVVEAPSRSPAAEEADTPAAINTSSTHKEEEEAAPRNGKKDTRNTQQRIKRGRDDGTVAAKQSQSVVADSPRNDASEDAPRRTVARRGRKKKEL